jgi:trans-aconitate 2-methyltransferase
VSADGAAASRARYTFGDTKVAVQRLALLAQVFEAPSRCLLESVAGPRIGRAVDVGSGPGFSTSLVKSVLDPQEIVGLDRSKSFLDHARSLALGARWFCHDVTVVPFPCGPADVVFARLVLAHLPEPEAVLCSWLGELELGGRLLIEEDEYIEFGHPLLSSYEEMAASLVSDGGGDLYVGRRLAVAALPEDVEVVLSRVVPHAVDVPVVARMFAMNFATWRHEAHISERHAPETLDAMAQGLDELAASDPTSEVVFGIRQMVIARTR